MNNNISHNIALASILFGSVYLNATALTNLQNTLTTHHNPAICVYTYKQNIPLYISYIINGSIFASTSIFLGTMFILVGTPDK